MMEIVNGVVSLQLLAVMRSGKEEWWRGSESGESRRRLAASASAKIDLDRLAERSRVEESQEGPRGPQREPTAQHQARVGLR